MYNIRVSNVFCVYLIHFSDTYRIQDEFGDTIAELTLNDIKNQSLLEKFGLYPVLRSMALQKQEEIDKTFYFI